MFKFLKKIFGPRIIGEGSFEYSFQAMDRSGRKYKGIIKANSAEEALEIIKSQGYFCTELKR